MHNLKNNLKFLENGKNELFICGDEKRKIKNNEDANKKIKDGGRVKTKRKGDKGEGDSPTHHRSAIFFGSIVKSNGRINRGKGASA